MLFVPVWLIQVQETLSFQIQFIQILALGIDLGGDGITPNDPGDVDGDIGPRANNLQNFPELESVSFSPGFVTVKGSLDSPVTTNNDYTLQFFANNIKDDSGYGEGTVLPWFRDVQCCW